MVLPTFETTDYKCSDCGAKTSYLRDKHNGKDKWYRNKEKGVGFWCKRCYERYYNRYIRKNNDNKGDEITSHLNA